MNCPCGSQSLYVDCCARYLEQGEKPETAEQLMRSRYSAYVQGSIDYLVETTHPSTRRADLRAGYQATHDSIQWVGLEVVSCFQGMASNKTGKVEFKASYVQSGERSVHHEKSRFKRHAGQWHYVDGEVS